MKVSRLLAPAASAALIAATALAVAPAASASGHTTHRSTKLPAASSISPTPGKQATITATGDSAFPTRASVDWTIPACSGTVYAYFQLNQPSAASSGPGPVYVQQKGASAYSCKATPQTVTVTYSGASPYTAALTAGTVTLTTTTKPAVSGSTVLKTSTTTVPAVVAASTGSGGANLPDAASVVPRFAQGVVLHADASSSTGVVAATRWVIPACKGTVRAAFSLFQDGETSPRALQQKAATDYPCSPADQSVTVNYWPTDPSSPAVHSGTAQLQVDTYDPTRSTSTATRLKSTTHTAQVS